MSDNIEQEYIMLKAIEAQKAAEQARKIAEIESYFKNYINKDKTSLSKNK